MKWNKLKVEEFADVIGGGTPSTSNASFWDGGIPWITPKDLSGYEARFIERGERNITEEGLRKSSAKILPAGAVLLSTRAPVGYVAIAENPLCTNQGFKSLITKPETANNEFIYYLLKQNRSFLESQATGATYKELNGGRLKQLLFPIPPIKIQQRIASILSAYDDLIENNQRRIKLLEDSARQLYKEWFVRLRFPGYEHTKIIKGVPEGWEKVRLKELCESINYGYTASAQADEVGPKFLRITDIVQPIIDWSSVPFCEIPDNKRNQFLLKGGDIVVARTGATVGYAKRLHRRHPEAVFASYLVRFRIKDDVDNMLIGIFVESDQYKSYVKAQIGGAAQPNANAQVLAGATILLPSSNLQKWFREIVEPIFDQKELLQIQNQKLRQARDILLPKLMSGEVEV